MSTQVGELAASAAIPVVSGGVFSLVGLFIGPVETASSDEVVRMTVHMVLRSVQTECG